MKRLFPFLFLVILSAGCKQEKICDCIVPYEIAYLKAKVIETSDISCHKPVLDFSEDSIRIREITGLDSLDYNTVNLPDIYKLKNKKLYVSVTKATSEEAKYVCNTLGIALPVLKIADAKSRD